MIFIFKMSHKFVPYKITKITNKQTKKKKNKLQRHLNYMTFTLAMALALALLRAFKVSFHDDQTIAYNSIQFNSSVTLSGSVKLFSNFDN